MELTFQYVETNATKIVNIRVVDFGYEKAFGSSHWIIFWKK